MKTKASYFTKLFGFALLFFDRYCTWAKQNKKRVFCWQMTTEQKKRSCFKKFLRVWFSLFWVKLSWERRLKFFSTLFLSLKNKLSQRENFHYVRLVLIFDTVFLKSCYGKLLFNKRKVNKSKKKNLQKFPNDFTLLWVTSRAKTTFWSFLSFDATRITRLP